jgi:cyclopropane fatty-acyl-phospholipid synthase-like methyltransferase
VVEEQPSFDAAKYKNAQREQWNKDGAAWRRWNPTLGRWYGDVTRQMLDLARIQPGQRILDVAAGAGEPAVSAAERVGPGGYVLATDISEGICESVWNEVEGSLRTFESSTGFEVPGECLVGAATR